MHYRHGFRMAVASAVLNILYLVHDLSDPAVRRRVLMLQAGGASVRLAGFRRSTIAAAIPGADPIDLGVTHDGGFAQRIFAVANTAAKVRQAFGAVSKPDIIVARNLEMLAIAGRAKAMFGDASLPIVYESLDIHRLMLRDDTIGKTLRAVERFLARDVSLLVTSSPAFVREYFEPYGQVDAPVDLVENKHLELEPAIDAPADRRSPPWRIGWFGALRCTRSLDILSAFARRNQGMFEVVLRGRPALTAIPDFERRVDAAPHVSYLGPYRNPEDVGAIYGQVHFSWAIDFFEEGQNSRWLLPNRLYEGCRFGAVPIALEGTETARAVAELGVGIVLREATADCLAEALVHMNDDRYAALASAVSARGVGTWASDRAACRALVGRLSALRSPEQTARRAAA
jgi:succinoglycan biosynthesis protein ExoL